MIDATDAGAGEPRWLALPQATTAMLTGGEWRPAAVRVVAQATSERVWEAGWHPGLFPPLPGGARQEIAAPYLAQLRGVFFSVWSDNAAAQTPGEVFDGIRRPLRAMAERAWNGGRRLMHTEFCDIDARIGVMNDATGFSR